MAQRKLSLSPQRHARRPSSTDLAVRRGEMATGVEVFMSGGVRYRGTHRWQWGANICTVEGGGEGVPERFNEIALTTIYHLLYQ